MDKEKLRQDVFEACGYVFEQHKEFPDNWCIITPNGQFAGWAEGIAKAIERYPGGLMDSNVADALGMFGEYATINSDATGQIASAIEEITNRSVGDWFSFPEEEQATALCEAIILLAGRRKKDTSHHATC